MDVFYWDHKISSICSGYFWQNKRFSKKIQKIKIEGGPPKMQISHYICNYAKQNANFPNPYTYGLYDMRI